MPPVVDPLDAGTPMFSVFVVGSAVSLPSATTVSEKENNRRTIFEKWTSFTKDVNCTWYIDSCRK
jgi:hypothetical protein